jgi:hypothetical protein
VTTTAQLIAALQAADPTGDLPVVLEVTTTSGDVHQAMISGVDVTCASEGEASVALTGDSDI